MSTERFNRARISDLSVLLLSLGAKRQDPAEPVWDIKEPGLFRSIRHPESGAIYSAARRELLRVAITEWQARNLVIDETEVAAVTGVSEYRNAEYRLSPDVDVGALDKAGLYCGSWLLYASAEVEPPPDILLAFQAVDVFRAASADLVAFLSRIGVHFLLASFYDDIDWRVVVPAKSLQAE